MTWINQTIEAFGREMGLPSLALEPGKSLQFQYEASGKLCIETRSPEVLVYLSRPVRIYESQQWWHALEYCHYQKGWPYPIQAGLRDETLVFLARIPEDRFTLPCLTGAVTLLKELFNEFESQIN